VALIAIIPLVDASPGDPTWRAGIYDGAGYDEVVSLPGNTSAVLSWMGTTGALASFASLEACAFAAVAGVAFFLALLFRSLPTKTATFTHRMIGDRQLPQEANP
jgi:hypothetical protein